MASNTLILPSIVAKEALIVLENELVMGNLVHKTFSKEFQKVGSTITVRKPTSFVSSAVSDTVNWSTAVESSITVVLDQHLDVSFDVTSTELTLNVADFREQFIAPAMKAHAQKIDTLLTALYANVGAYYNVSTTASVSDMAQLRAVLNANKVPMSNRYLVFDPATEAEFLPLEAFLHAEKRGDTRAIKEASMGRVLGFDCYMDQNIASHTIGGMTGGGTAVSLLKGAATKGATLATVDGMVSGGTAFVGDCFKITGSNSGDDAYYVVTTLSTANVSTAVLAVSPPLKVAYADDSTVTFAMSGRSNLAFHKNAFALVTAPLEPPLGGASYAVETYKGVSCRVVYDYNIMTKKNICSIDLLCGVKTLDPNLAARFNNT